MFNKILFIAVLCTTVGINAMALYSTPDGRTVMPIPNEPWNEESRTYMVGACQFLLNLVNSTDSLDSRSPDKHPDIEALHKFVLWTKNRLYTYNDTQNATEVGQIASQIHLRKMLLTRLPLGKNS